MDAFAVLICAVLFGTCLSIDCGGHAKEGCSAGTVWNETSNSCLPCPPGYWGLKCNNVCRSPYYGMHCVNMCNCSDSDCDPALGCKTLSTLASLACPPGYWGIKCNNICRFPYYGMHCLNMCDCSDSDCDPALGCETLTTLSSPDESDDEKRINKAENNVIDEKRKTKKEKQMSRNNISNAVRGFPSSNFLFPWRPFRGPSPSQFGFFGMSDPRFGIGYFHCRKPDHQIKDCSELKPSKLDRK